MASAAPVPATTATGGPLPSRWWVLGVLSLAQVLVMLDVSIINTAIPAIAREFEASSATLQWLVDSYALLFAGLLLLAGALGDRYGRRRLLALGLTVFAAGSIGAALSSTATVLIVLRGVQGVGAALVIPQTLSILTAVFPREERSKAIGLWTGALGLGTAGGPLVGGALVDAINWSAVFWVPAPIALAALIGLRIVPESRSAGAQRLDFAGALLGTVGIGALVYGVIEGQDAGWTSAEIIAAFAAAAGALLAFLLVEGRVPNPMLPLKFFRQRDFNGSVIVLFLVFFALMGVMFFLSQYFQLVQGKSALTAGIYLLPTAVAMMISAPIAGRMITVVGPKALIVLSMLIGVGVLLSLTQLEVDTPYWQVGIAMGVFGLGGGMAMPTVTDTTMAAVPVNEAGRASGVSNTGRQVGGAIGIAVLGSIAATIYADGVRDALTGVAPDIVQRTADGIGGAAVLSRTLPPDTAALVVGAAHPAFVDAITTVFAIGAAFMGFAALAGLWLIPLRIRAVQMSDAPVAPAAPVPAPAVSAPAVPVAASSAPAGGGPVAGLLPAVMRPRPQKSSAWVMLDGDAPAGGAD